jgi:hypothetical protein
MYAVVDMSCKEAQQLACCLVVKLWGPTGGSALSWFVVVRSQRLKLPCLGLDCAASGDGLREHLTCDVYRLLNNGGLALAKEQGVPMTAPPRHNINGSVHGVIADGCRLRLCGRELWTTSQFTSGNFY